MLGLIILGDLYLWFWEYLFGWRFGSIFVRFGAIYIPKDEINSFGFCLFARKKKKKLTFSLAAWSYLDLVQLLIELLQNETKLSVFLKMRSRTSNRFKIQEKNVAAKMFFFFFIFSEKGVWKLYFVIVLDTFENFSFK